VTGVNNIFAIIAARGLRQGTEEGFRIWDYGVRKDRAQGSKSNPNKKYKVQNIKYHLLFYSLQ